MGIFMLLASGRWKYLCLANRSLEERREREREREGGWGETVERRQRWNLLEASVSLNQDPFPPTPHNLKQSRWSCPWQQQYLATDPTGAESPFCVTAHERADDKARASYPSVPLAVPSLRTGGRQSQRSDGEGEKEMRSSFSRPCFT